MRGRCRQDLKERLSRKACDLGFDAIGFAPAELPALAARHLEQFVSEGRHGDMTWMATTLERRRHPKALWPQAQTAIVLGQSYAPVASPFDVLERRDRAAISCYAQGKDYHDIIKGRLKQLAAFLQREATGVEVKVFVDTAPLMEKPLAQAAGLGWQGKHTNLVSRQHGSWLFLGVILTTAEIEPDNREADHCGSCRRCLDVCPTDAFPSAYQLDARRCIAYLTIEHKGHIPTEFRRPIGNRVFGCDDCLAVCPWNKFAKTAREVRLLAREATDAPPLADLLALDDASFRQRFAGTPLKRTGRDRVVRNALIAAGNSEDDSLKPAVKNLLDDCSPLVRAMAVWALWRLTDDDEFARERMARLSGETDAAVRDEWKGSCRA